MGNSPASIGVAFIRAFAVFCGLLGLLWGGIKVLKIPPELIYLAPAVTLVYLATELLYNGKRRAISRKRNK